VFAAVRRTFPGPASDDRISPAGAAIGRAAEPERVVTYEIIHLHCPGQGRHAAALLAEDGGPAGAVSM
jgi:hypothetical protein